MTTAADIPVAHTPSGFWHGEMPPPVLAGCDEPLAPGVPDLRGLWTAYLIEEHGKLLEDLRHTERIEQCGNRIVITAGGVIHDMYADGTLEHGVNDIAARTGQPISVAATFEDGKLVLRPNNAFIAVTRHLEGNELVWTVVPLGRTYRMRKAEPAPSAPFPSPEERHPLH